MIGDWLQIRFENEDSAWVLWRKEGSGRKQYETDIVDFVPAGNLSSDHTDSMATMHHVPSSVFNRQDQPSTSTEVTIFDNAEEELEQDNIWLRKFRKQYNRYDISKNVFYKINDLCGVNTKGGPLKATSKKQDLFLILLPDDVYRQLAECVDPSPIKHQKAATQSYRNMESKLNSALASKRVISPFSVTEEQLLQSVLNIDRELQLGNNPLANSVNALGKETPPIFGIKVVAPMYYQKENTEGDDDDKSYDSLYQYGPSRYHDEEEAVQHLHGLLPFGLAGYVDNRAYEEEDVDEEDSGADEDDRKFDEETLQLEDMF